VTTHDDLPIGERIRFFRRGRSQAVVAGLAEITENYLSQIERGLKTPTLAVLQRLATVLGVPVSVLLGEPSSAPESAIHPVAPALQAALMTYQATGAEPVSPVELRARVAEAWRVWQATAHRFTSISPLLPVLTADVQLAVRTAPGDAAVHREVQRVAADFYFLLRTVCKRIGRTDLALLAADRGMAAAWDSDDPLRALGAEWNLGQTLLSQGEAQAALDLSVGAARDLEPRLPGLSPEYTALCGALWLNAAAAASRLRDTWQARDILREHAGPLSRRVPDASNTLWTVFGPTNVALHALGVEVEAGETTEALRIAQQIDVSGSPSMERRTTFYLQLAACYEQRRDDMGVLVHLQGAQETGPEDLRFNRVSRDLVRGLLKRSRSSIAPQARRLAADIGVVAL
jgi:transcriptional regulator with XRE-family HTH domain